MSVLDKILKGGSTPIVLGVTIAILVGAAAVQSFASSEVSSGIFQGAVLASILEVFLLMFGLARQLEAVDERIRASEDDFSLVAPPHATGHDLVNLLESTGTGSLKIICYGTNKYGQVLEIIQARFPRIRTSVVLCSPEQALTTADAEDLRTIIIDLKRSQHLTVEPSAFMPTIRAAVFRRDDGVPLWASVSFYLIHQNRRGLRSEGHCPVLLSRIPGSRPMRTLCEFVDAEFERLKQSIAPIPDATAAGRAG